MNLKLLASILLLLSIPQLLWSQETLKTEHKHLTVERLFSSGEFREEALGTWIWSSQSNSYFRLEKSGESKNGRDLVRFDCETGERSIVARAELFVPSGSENPKGSEDALTVDGLQFSKDERRLLVYTNSQRVWRQNTRGDYWLLDLESSELKKLGGEKPAASMMFAKFSPDAKQIAFVCENNLYLQQLDSLELTQLTHDGSSEVINGTGDWVNEEELDIRDGFRWSPDGKAIAYWQFDTREVPRFTMLDNTSEKYPRVIEFAYPKVGESNSASRVGVVTLSDRRTTWISLNAANPKDQRLDDPRENYVARMDWMPDSSQLILQRFNRLQNQNHVFLADVAGWSGRQVLTETEETWLENENPLRWLKAGEEFLWVSERDGWRHAYRAQIGDGKVTLITDGKFDVIDIEAIDTERGWLYFAASPEQATQRYLYKVALSGGDAERVSPIEQEGWHTYNIAPSGQFAIHTYSNFRTPPVVELVELPSHKVVKKLIDNESLRKKLNELDLPSIKFSRVEIEKDISLDAWCIKPPGFDENDTETKYPVLFHVYGEPHGQTVRDAWPSNRGLWHWMMAQRGYLVISVDNRGTMSPRGRQWRKCVHRQIGILASQEQAAAARALLRRWPQADQNRVGIWGWSGGGSMSLNAIFRHPDIYHTAVAVAPVPNQLLYDTIYQERYMGLPNDNTEGYKFGSPITFAKQLQGDLLVIHGTADDNCHYQGIELLMNELIAHNKQFSLMAYPGRSHSISEGKNTATHFYGLMTHYFDEHLRDRITTEPGINAGKSSALSDWQTKTIEGWQVHVRKQLFIEQAEPTDRAIELLTQQLQEIVRVVPKDALAKLREVPLWLSPEYPKTPPRAEYHPGADWLRDHQREPAMAKGVEFTNIRIFEAETRRMPNFALHELAHAFHDRVLDYDHAGIKTAFERAKAAGTYDRVLRQDSEGQKRYDRAYALTSPQEYFAETTEAFFSRNDFEPFDSEQLKAMDPSMFELLKTLWGTP